MVELKVVTRGRRVNLSPHQVAFHAKHADLRCPTFILVRYQPTGTAHAHKSMLMLYAGEQALELHKLGLDLEPVAKWPWVAVPWHLLRAEMLNS